LETGFYVDIDEPEVTLSSNRIMRLEDHSKSSERRKIKKNLVIFVGDGPLTGILGLS